MNVLEDFCFQSGQKVNFNKSKLFCSHNTPRREANRLSLICGMPLAMYVGVNIVHGRFKVNHCSHVVEKMKRKLAGWKAKCLSFAGRSTLIKAVTSTTIPNYVLCKC